jgi:transposase-like protein
MGSIRKFSKEFKLEAVRRVSEEDHGVSDVARELDISPAFFALEVRLSA